MLRKPLDAAAAAAAIKIQCHFRGFLARKKYPPFHHLGRARMESYQAFIIGNDPCIKGLQPYASSERMALVATSGLRALLLACQLNKSKLTPKIFLVDNSKEVCGFWRNLRDFTYDSKHNRSQLAFMQTLGAFLSANEKLYRSFKDDNFERYERDGVEYPFQSIPAFFTQLFSKYGFKYVCDIIRQTSVIAQSWSDQPTFRSIKTHIDTLGIKRTIVYPSNIVECALDDGHKTIATNTLTNIDLLGSALAIHTVCGKGSSGVPNKVFLVTHKSAEQVYQMIDKDRVKTESQISSRDAVEFMAFISSVSARI